MAFFGESGLNIVKVAAEMEGGFDAFTKKIQEMGLAFDEDGIRQAKEFDQEMKMLESRFSGVGRAIAKELMPIFLGFARDIANWLKENPGAVKSWATFIGNEVKTLIDLINKLKTAWEFLSAQRSTDLRNFGQRVQQQPEAPVVIDATKPPPVTASPESIVSNAEERAKKEEAAAEKRKQEREKELQKVTMVTVRLYYLYRATF